MTPKRSFLLTLSIFLLLYIQASNATLFSSHLRSNSLDFIEQTAENGYTSETHTVTTEDGYILTMFRIVKAKHCNGTERSPPVLLMHGLLLSADTWIDAGTKNGIAYQISDECHDVWLGNSRGNYYSRAHTSLNPDKDSTYWDFDTNEMGKYDNPAMIDYVLNHTGSNKLNYVGYSQGAGTFLIMCSERPEYCHKASLMIAMAPGSRLIHTKSLLLRTLCEFYEILYGTFKDVRATEVLYLGSPLQSFAQFFCTTDTFAPICDLFIQLLDHVGSLHLGSMSQETVKRLFKHFPAGTSLRNMVWYNQAFRNESMVKFNYGKKTNLVKYGSETPPKYNMSAVTAPVVCFYGENDGLADMNDVRWLLSELPNVVEGVLVDEPHWTHFDQTYSQYIHTYTLPKIQKYLNKYSRP